MCEAEVAHRVSVVSKAIRLLREEVIERRELNKSTNLKLGVIGATVRPTLLYACETWTAVETQEQSASL